MSTVILWLDKEANSASSFREKLSQSSDVQTFTSSDECIGYIKSHLTDNLFLIASGSLAEHVVPQVSECSNVKQIFVFCASIHSHVHWASDYVERLLMFDHEDDLFERLWKEMEKWFREQAEERLEQAEDMKDRAKQYKQPCG